MTRSNLCPIFLSTAVSWREGFLRTGETVTVSVDGARRRAIQRNHTATHLLHKALRTVLGTETHQAGSLVAPDRLRFDFTSIDAMSQPQVERVAEIVNAEILEVFQFRGRKNR